MNQEITKKNKIHILHLVEGLGMGGAEALLIQYIKSLGMEEYEHFVYYFGVDGPVRERIEALGVKVYAGKKRALIRYPVKFIISLIKLIIDVIKFIKNKRINIIQSHLSYANKLGVLTGKLTGVPAFPTIHSTMAFVDKRSIWDIRVYINKILDWLIFLMSDSIIAVSQEIGEIVHKQFRIKKSKIIVIKNGIVFENENSIPANINKEFSIPDNTLKILAVGRLFHEKGMDVLIKAAAELVKQGFNDFIVMVAGDGDKRQELINLICNLRLENKVILLGLRDDIIKLMRVPDIFVIPSRYEGLSLAMIEAMACGLPIVASDAPGLSTYIQNQHNGLLFPVEDYKALSNCIIRLANDEEMRSKLAHKARESFEQEYNMIENIKLLDMIFQEFALQ